MNKKIRYDLIPTNGMKVLIKGSLSVFETSGQYQIYVNKITEDGIGDLYYQFEQLKKKLKLYLYRILNE